MPFRVKCHHCGKIIYESNEILSPSDVITKLDGKCPKCGKTLKSFPSDVKVTKHENPQGR